jgi:rod shape determining protein RodA
MFSFIYKDLTLTTAILFLIVISTIVLRSIAPSLFPLYFLSVFVSLVAFWLFSSIDFEIVSIFSKLLYGLSVIILLLPFVVGTVTRGTIRWIELGPLSFQPAEIVRPFLLVFFAGYLTHSRITFKRLIFALFLLFIPLFLILVQPSLGVSFLTFIGFFGILLASNFNKKYIILGALASLLLIPVLWNFMAPYQKERVQTFINPSKDPQGAGYNSLQSMIAAGSGKLFGVGLGHGTQTQLSFLPEKQTDFIFAATAEELGFLGAGILLLATLVILYRLTRFMEVSSGRASRAYLAGFFLTYLVQVFIHVGMNLGMVPVTGVPFPLVSAGGSSLLATMIGLGMAFGAVKSKDYSKKNWL